MEAKIKKWLTEPNNRHRDEFLSKLNSLLEMSMSKMSAHYEAWDHFEQVYRQSLLLDKNDREAVLRGEPTKIIVPHSYAQVQTFVAFMIMLFGQRDDFFEIEGSGPEDSGKPATLAQKVLNADLRRNAWAHILYMWLLDVAKFGIGILKHSWETASEEVTVTDEIFGQSRQFVEVTRGNKIINVTPYRFYPDTRLPLVRFQEGEFVASEEEHSKQHLSERERRGEIVGVKDIPDSDFMLTSGGKEKRRFSGGEGSLTGNVSSMVLVTEYQIKLVPNKIKISDTETLGPEDYPVVFVVEVANDKQILRVDRANYAHNKFNYHVAQYSPDLNQLVGQSICEVVEHLQEVITWFINSHIASVKNTLTNRLVIDPRFIELDDVRKRSPVIRTKPGASQSGIQNWLMQLNVVDVTRAHIEDANLLGSFLQYTTGINDNALGQYFSGRRSAQEARAVNQAASGRLRVVAGLLWEVLADAGRCWLTNLQKGLTLEDLKEIAGDGTTEEDFIAFQKKRPDGRFGRYDFKPADGTLPSEKGFVAQAMQEILLGLMSDPNAMMAFTQEPARSLLIEICALRKIPNPERFLPPPTNGVIPQQPLAGAGLERPAIPEEASIV